MAIFGNFKGTTQPDFRVGKTGARIHGNSSIPASADAGDFWLDKSNSTLQVYNSNAWTSIGATLTTLNVDSGTLFVDSANDTVSIGSTSSNEKLFVNGSLRLGTNPAIKYSGAYVDIKHANGTGTVVRIRDNDNNTAPIFKVYGANNESEVFKVQGTNVTVANAYVLPTSDGGPGHAIVTDGSGNLSFASLVDPVEDYGSISEAANITRDYGSVLDNADVTLYQYTDALARAAISVTDAGGEGSLAYNSSTGVITYTGPAGGGPAFSAYAAAVLQTITSGSQQKVLFQTEEFDTNNNFANSRFTPTVAGYYQLNAEVRLDGTSGTGEMMIVIWKNGSEYKRGTNQSGTQIASNFWAMQVSSLVYANGTTDYFEIYVQQGSGADRTVTAVNSPNITWFNGCMMRGA